MPVRLSCPSCNTGFALPQLPADRRAACPRCGDAFPIRTWEDGGDPASPPPPAARPAAKRRSYMPAVVLLLVLAFIGTGVWISFTRGPKPKPTPEAAGLAYLPADTNVVFVVRAGPVLDYARRTNQTPDALLKQAGVPAQALGAIASLGLTFEQIDHLAGGAYLANDAADLRLTLALVLREPIADEEQFLSRVKARRQPGGAEGRYGVQLGPLPATLALVSPTVVVVGVDPKKDFEAVDRGGYGKDGKQFGPSLAATIAEQVPPDAAAWFATAEANWAEKPLVKLAAQVVLKKPEWLTVMARGRAAMAALSLGDEPRVKVFVKAADEETGRALRDYFKLQAADAKGRHDGSGEVAIFEAPIDPANAFATIERFLRDAAPPPK